MLYQTEIKNNVKTWLDLGAEYDAFLDLTINVETRKILKLCNRLEEEMDTEEGLKDVVMYGVIIAFNKRFNEGIKQSGVSGFQSVFDEADRQYKALIISNKKLKVL